jgi:hypothetical protein
MILVQNDFPKHITLMIVSWKLESCKYLRENKLLSSSNSKLDRWIMFLMLHRFMGIINDLELSYRFIALNNFSIPGDKSGEPQKGILDDYYLHCYCSHYLHEFNDLRATFVGIV